jgi:hypothetical protein
VLGATGIVAALTFSGIVLATAPVVAIDPIGPLEYATFPQLFNVTGTVTHTPNVSSISELKLYINDVQEGPTQNPSGVTTVEPFSMPWNILGPGTYTVKVTARHGNGIGMDSEEVIVTQSVVVTECPAAPAIAAAYMRSHSPSVKGGSATWKMVMTNIAGRTGAKGDLWAANACAAGYAASVQAAVNALLGW